MNVMICGQATKKSDIHLKFLVKIKKKPFIYSPFLLASS
jgi:hypothetical protein